MKLTMMMATSRGVDRSCLVHTVQRPPRSSILQSLDFDGTRVGILENGSAWEPRAETVEKSAKPPEGLPLSNPGGCKMHGTLFGLKNMRVTLSVLAAPFFDRYIACPDLGSFVPGSCWSYREDSNCS